MVTGIRQDSSNKQQQQRDLCSAPGTEVGASRNKSNQKKAIFLFTTF